MRFLILAVFLMTSFNAYALGCGEDVPTMYNADWKSCSDDSQCMLIKGACGFNATVNAVSAEEASCYFEASTKKQPYCPEVVEKPIGKVYCDAGTNTCLIEYQ